MIGLSILERVHFANKLGVWALHADEKPTKPLYRNGNAAIVFLHRITARQCSDIVCNMLPSTQVKVTNTEIGALYTHVRKNIMKSGFKFLPDVVEYL